MHLRILFIQCFLFFSSFKLIEGLQISGSRLHLIEQQVFFVDDQSLSCIQKQFTNNSIPMNIKKQLTKSPIIPNFLKIVKLLKERTAIRKFVKRIIKTQAGLFRTYQPKGFSIGQYLTVQPQSKSSQSSSSPRNYQLQISHVFIYLISIHLAKHLGWIYPIDPSQLQGVSIFEAESIQQQILHIGFEDCFLTGILTFFRIDSF